MNIFTVLSLIISCFNLIFTIHVNLGVLHYDNADELNKVVIERVDRYYQRQGVEPVVNFFQTTISNTSLLSANDTVCRLTGMGVMGLIGPTLSPIIPTLQSICNNLEIPHIQYVWKPASSAHPEMTINFYPDSQLLAKGIAALVSSMNWKSFTVLYETSDGLARLKDVLRLSVPRESPVIFKQIHPGMDYRPIFKEVKNFTDNTIIIECELDRVIPILMQAKEVRMLEFHHKYFLANLDAHTLNFEPLQSTANITTVRLLNTSSVSLMNAVKDWNDLDAFNLKAEQVKTEQAILCDAAYFFMRRFHELRYVDGVSISEPLFCNEQKTSEKGFRIYSYMLGKSEEEGVSGPIQFDNTGRRIDFKLHAVEIIENTKEVIADWRPYMNDSAHYQRNLTKQMQAAVESLQKIKVIVASKFGPPYLIEVKGPNGEKLEGKEGMEGYAYDVIAEIANDMNFTFEFRTYVDTGTYIPATKQWTGIIRALLDRKAHLAICDLTITEARRSILDFSLPFMNLGVSILHSKAKVTEDTNKFAFMDPFDFEVWVYTVTLYLIISTFLYVICRFAPGDWENPHPCDPDPEELENIWDLKNCFWLTLGSIMTQGCDILPKGISSRMGASMWWFFSLIMTSSYTANLAAFLTKERMGTTISNAEDLAKQTKIKYGTVLDGATMSFFKNSNFSTYQRLWANMEQANPSVFEKTNAKGVKRVLSAKNQLYAFFMESSSIEYEKEKNCNLKQVGGRLDSKGYGIAMPMNSAYRSAIDQAILKLQESGKLAELKEKWWKKKVVREGSCADDQEKEESSNELALDNVGGVFIVLWVGVALAFVLAFAEFLWNVQKVAVEEHITYWEALMIEIKFAVKVWITKKRVKPVLSDASSHVSDTRSIAQRVMKTAGSFINLDVFDKLNTAKKE